MNKFKKGDRVRLSAEGLLAMRFRSRRPGEVVGVRQDHPVGRNLDEDMVRILRDGTKTPVTWHEDFWELDTVTSALGPYAPPLDYDDASPDGTEPMIDDRREGEL